MAQPDHPPNSATGRGAGTELWLLCPGSEQDRAQRLSAFADADLSLVVAPPGGMEASWAADFARAHSARLATAEDLRPAAGEEAVASVAERVWLALERALGTGSARVLAVLPGEVLPPLVARALGFPLERAQALRVDPGRAVLLRDDPGGIVLRRSNVCAPERRLGTALPGSAP